MAIKFESVEFGKQGRGNEGEKFTANQLTEDSLDASSVETLVADAMTAVGNDLQAFREAAWLGINKYLKNLAGGSDEASKLAAQIVKSGMAAMVDPSLVGKSKAEVAAWLRARK
jgi:hypothetical protein